MFKFKLYNVNTPNRTRSVRYVGRRCVETPFNIFKGRFGDHENKRIYEWILCKLNQNTNKEMVRTRVSLLKTFKNEQVVFVDCVAPGTNE